MSGAPLEAINRSLQTLRRVVSQRPDVINDKTNLIKQEITEINDLIGQLKERMQMFNGLQRDKESLQRELENERWREEQGLPPSEAVPAMFSG